MDLYPDSATQMNTYRLRIQIRNPGLVGPFWNPPVESVNPVAAASGKCFCWVSP